MNTRCRNRRSRYEPHRRAIARLRSDNRTMAMTIVPNGAGGYELKQRLLRPVVYLDHWAVRKFSENAGLQDRFIELLHKSRGTWLFSAANLSEFTVVTDLAQAEAVERLLLRAMPSLYVADTVIDHGFFFAVNPEPHSNTPDQHWMLRDLGDRAAIICGVWNTHRFVRDAIHHQAHLRPLFDSLKQGIAVAVATVAADPENIAGARKFQPLPGMTLRGALLRELLREVVVRGAAEAFSDNDAMDFIHAASTVPVCDFVLLDSAWCHRVNSSARRMRKGGVTGVVAQCFSPKTISEFLIALDACKHLGMEVV